MCENRFIEEKIFLFIIFHQIYMKKPKGVRLLTTVRHLTFLRTNRPTPGISEDRVARKGIALQACVQGSICLKSGG